MNEVQKPSKEFVFRRYELIKAMQEALDKIEETKAHTPEARERLSDIVVKIRKNYKKQFVSLIGNEEFFLSYAKDIALPFDPKKRVSTNAGRYIRRQLEIDVSALSDTVLDDFCNKVNAVLIFKNIGTLFKVVKGDDLREYYRTVTGINSCMVGQNSYRVELYAINPDKCALLTFKKEARALLWTCDDGTKVVDKIYGNNKHNSIFQAWADANGAISVYSLKEQKAITMKYRTYLPSVDSFYFVTYDRHNRIMVMHNKEYRGCERTAYEKILAPGQDYIYCANCRACIWEDEIRDNHCKWCEAK